ncbi:MAG: hypothetical protein M1482_11410 [Chloroflexi bacterium]|nr:hypothetical protein [Chloroflexota bacterium]
MSRKRNANKAWPGLCRALALAGLVLTSTACLTGGQLTASSTPTNVVTAQATNTLTPTPTRVIGVVEVTPTPVVETWQGTIHSETTGNYGAAGVCSGEAWDMQFQIQVAGDASLTGKGTGTIASMPSCSGPGFTDNNYVSHEAKNLQFSVRGSRKDNEFGLQFTETGIDGSTAGLINYSLLLSASASPPLLVVPITGPSTASGQTSVTVPVPASDGGTAVGKHKVTLTCTSCK